MLTARAYLVEKRLKQKQHQQKENIGSYTLKVQGKAGFFPDLQDIIRTQTQFSLPLSVVVKVVV
jgi:hypothetical protein